METEIEDIINKTLERYEFELSKDEYSVVATELAQEIVKLFAIPDVVGQSEQFYCFDEKNKRIDRCINQCDTCKELKLMQ